MVNINQLDKKMDKYVYNKEQAPWDYLNISPLEYLQYLLYAKNKIAVNRQELLAAIKDYDYENFPKNEQFFNEIFGSLSSLAS